MFNCETHWVISSGKIGPGVPGPLYLINVSTQSRRTVLPRGDRTSIEQDRVFAAYRQQA